MSIDIFGHVLSLDHNFHLHRKTGELLRIMDRGTVSVQTLLGTVMFQIGPAMFDIAAAAAFLAIRMQLWIAVIVFVSLGVYMPMTIYVTEYRGKYRRELNKLDNARSSRATDALLNYETIKVGIRIICSLNSCLYLDAEHSLDNAPRSLDIWQRDARDNKLQDGDRQLPAD